MASVSDFETAITTEDDAEGSGRGRLVGPYRSPAQMLQDQTYDGHMSVHDEATASSLGLSGAPIEAPTHFSQIDPLAVARWGRAWFERGCVSAHFRTMVVEGEQVQASLTPTGDDTATIEAHKPDGTTVLTGTADIAVDPAVTELGRRLAALGDPGELFVIDRLQVGMRSDASDTVVMSRTERNGDSYPFSLDEKLARITEPHPWYTAEGGAASPWGRAVVPFEMISVLASAVALLVAGPQPVARAVPRPAGGAHRRADLRRPALRPRARVGRAQPVATHRVVLDPHHGHRRHHRRRGRLGAVALRCLQSVVPGLSAASSRRVAAPGPLAP